MPLGRNILIFHAGALGDFIVTWPLALTLARIYAQSRTFFVTQAGKGALAEAVLRVESLDADAGWHHLFGDAARLPEPLGKRLANSHSVVSFVAGPDDTWTKNVRAVTVPAATVLTLSTKIPADHAGHISEYLLEQVAPWTAAHTAGGQILRSIASRGLLPDRKPGDAIVVHPGSGAPRKNWPAARFLELVERLRRADRPVKVILGEVERETWDAPQIERLRAGATVIEPVTYLELLDHLRAARAFVGNDSGPGHLAGILGVPTLAVFGPTSDPVHWRPLGPAVDVVRTESLDALDAATVYDRLVRLLGE